MFCKVALENLKQGLFEGMAVVFIKNGHICDTSRLLELHHEDSVIDSMKEKRTCQGHDVSK